MVIYVLILRALYLMVPIGTEVYQCDASSCKGRGYSWSHGELVTAISSDVLNDVRDIEGRTEIASMFTDLSLTGFETSKLNEVLSCSEPLKPWRVGEAIASAYLTSHRNCCFPWDDSRDVRKPKSSLPGADLVGFSDTGDNCRFAFGEVKTSSENAYPPQVMSYSGDGLAAQMKNLRDDVLIRNRLLAYLGYRAKNAQWKDSFKTATRKYLNDQMDISVFGVLVRDVLPSEKDLKRRVIQLSSGNRVPLEMEAIALYLPDGAIEGLPVLCDSIERGDITC